MSDPLNDRDQPSRSNDNEPETKPQGPEKNEPDMEAPPRKPSEGKGRGGDESSSGTNLMWILGLTVVGIAILAILFSSQEKVQLEYSQLYQLIDKGPDGSIETTIGQKQNRRKVRISHLDNLQFNEHEIGGTITIETLPPGDESTEDSATEADSQPQTPSTEQETTPADQSATETKKADNDLIEKDVKFRTGRRGLEEHADELFDLAYKRGFKNISAESSPGTWRSFLPMLIFLGFFLAMFILLLRRVGGAGGAVAFGRSRGKFYAQDDIGVSFNDVAGIDEAVEELREIVDFLSNPDKYRRLGGRIPKGVLLVGPPGTGKTLLAKAVAGEARVPFFSISGSDFVEMFVGVGAARVRDMFQQAIQRAPCIIFIDELDALGKARGSGLVGGHDEREQTLNALLVEMDGFAGNSGVMIMAATNRPEMLDPALLRPGRFDRTVLVDRPDVRGREAILKVHVGSVTLDESVDLAKVAAITSGFCGADLANLVNEAALLAARAGKPTVTMAEFNEGVERVTAGLEKKQRLIHEEEKKRIAYHEAGHALVAHLTHATDPVHKISIIPRGLAALGYTMQRPEGDRYLMTFSELMARIKILVGGTVAEEMIFEDVSTGAQNDLQRATEIARSIVMDFGMSQLGRVTYRESGRSAFLETGDEYPSQRAHSEQTAREIDEEIRRIIDESIESARDLLRTRRQTLVDLAERLLEVEVIDNEELREIVGNHADENSDIIEEENERSS